MVESLVVALVLAFLLRTFEVEAFVIPTGSMAPTLMGRHKDVTCAKCGYLYQVGASRELDDSGRPTGYRLIAGICPICRFDVELRPDSSFGSRHPSYGGDRIAAGKFSYDLGDPKRWEVSVFRYPIDATKDYIKRVAGLPNETIRIQYGDVWVKPNGENAFRIARKPPEKVLAMMQPVSDDDYWPQELVRKKWPRPWAPLEAGDTAGGWRMLPDEKSFDTDGTAEREVWVAYRQVTPGYDDWAYLLGVSSLRPPPRKAELVRDFTAYDTAELWYYGRDQAGGQSPPPLLSQGLGPPPNPFQQGLNWVGDLIVEFELKASQGKGDVLVDLVKGGHHFVCRLQLGDGGAELSIPGDQRRVAAITKVRWPGKHLVRFANVDQQLLLWLDGKQVRFDAETGYESSTVDTKVPDKEDLLPARIGSRGAAVELSHLKLYRDIYYIAQRVIGENAYPSIPADLDPSRAGYPYVEMAPDALGRFFSDPGRWGVFGHRLVIEFRLGEGQFFMLGDNSAESKDSRLWDQTEFYVQRELLVGKALLVYWPHSWNKIPGTPIPFPYFPNFPRMRLIR